jgi:hypothetical protein
MSVRIKTTVIVLLILVNLGVLWWRYEHGPVNVQSVGPTIAKLGDAQVNTVLRWRNSKSAELTPSSITEYVANMTWSNCKVPDDVASKSVEITTGQRDLLSRSIVELMHAYRQPTAEALYDYMTSKKERLSGSSVLTLKKLLTEGNSIDRTTLEHKTPRELFLLIAEKISFGSHWDGLVLGTGRIDFWGSAVDRISVAEKKPLGGDMVKLFKNQTRYHHLFDWTELVNDQGRNDNLYADVEFVVKHNRELMSEPSAYHLRFLYDQTAGTWHPIEMIHVATVSGRSPVLLF